MNWKFIKSASDKNSWHLHDKKEICFIGRSNVGKSTLINALAKNKIAKTSKTPGRTRLINYFADQSENIIVDLPGYGYAKMSKSEHEKMIFMVEEYLMNSPYLVTIFLLFDARIGLTSLDEEMYIFFKSINKRIFLVGTKSEKNTQSENAQLQKKLKNYDAEIILVSSLKMKNIDKLSKIITEQFN